MGKPHKFQKEIIAWANGEDVQCKRIDLEDHIVCEWGPISNIYVFDSTSYIIRIKPPREYPKTSLTDGELMSAYINPYGGGDSLIDVANAAIRRYIDDQENKE